MSGTALLLLDLQHALCRGAMGQASGLAEEVERRDVLGRAAGALAAAREAGAHVIHVGVRFDPEYTNRLNRSARFSTFESNNLLQEGSADAEFCPDVAPQPGEPVVAKGCVNPFIGTGLEEILTVRRAHRLLLCGVATNFVVESTARHAGDSGYETVVLEDACAAYNEEMHKFSIERIMPTFAEVSTTERIIAELKGKGDGQQ